MVETAGTHRRTAIPCAAPEAGGNDGQILEAEVTRAATFEAALDAAEVGAVLVRGDMGIVHANAAADTMLQDGDPIRSTGGRLRLVEEIMPGHLETAVQVGAVDGSPPSAGGASASRRGARMVRPSLPMSPAARIPARHPAGRRRGGLRRRQWRGRTAAGESMELLFGLTPAEARVFELVAAGQSSRQIAAAMGIAPSTLRTHLLRVFDKTGRHHRVELVALAREILPTR